MAANWDEKGPCTIDELESIITAPSNGFVMLPDTPYDEICEGIYIGEGDSAKSVNCMKHLGVTHVLNAALGKDAFHVNTNHVMYRKVGIKFLGIEATDIMNYNLSKHFDVAVKFIDDAVRTDGKVFVHCVQGVSRSATLVLAYLMMQRNMTVQDALRLVRSKREVCPNPGFLQQLCDLNGKLQRSGHFESPLKPLYANDEAGSFASKEETNVETGHPSCTVEEVEKILTGPLEGCVVMPESVYSQIDKNIFIGEGDFALKVENLKRLQVTHVLNTAQWKGINSFPGMYTDAGLHFYGVRAADRPDCDLSQHFETAADFIEGAVKDNGKVYVHCVKGFSRSPTIVMAYYMLKQGLDLREAATLVRKNRETFPNRGFLQQLCDLHNRLALEGHFNKSK